MGGFLQTVFSHDSNSWFFLMVRPNIGYSIRIEYQFSYQNQSSESFVLLELPYLIHPKIRPFRNCYSLSNPFMRCLKKWRIRVVRIGVWSNAYKTEWKCVLTEEQASSWLVFFLPPHAASFSLWKTNTFVCLSARPREINNCDSKAFSTAQSILLISAHGFGVRITRIGSVVGRIHNKRKVSIDQISKDERVKTALLNRRCVYF